MACDARYGTVEQFLGEAGWIGRRLHEQRPHRADDRRPRDVAVAMPCQIVDHLAATGGMTDMHRILQVEMTGHRREIIGIVVHVVPVAGLRGPAVTAPVMRDDTVAASHEEHHLRVPVICREWPAMAENDGLPLAPVVVEDLHAVLRLDFAHGMLSFALGGRSCNSGRAAEISPAQAAAPPTRNVRREACEP